MPLRPLKQCKKCITLTRNVSGYCEEHELSKNEVSKRYDNSRDNKYVSFYNSVGWKKLRRQALARDYGVCQHCLREGQVIAADMVHHIVEVRVDWLLRLVLGNLVSLCDSCHKKIPHKSK
ncbi:HNH endonuclease [Clostridium sp. FP1]|uniref:HNH endonuclease n=1 Tax=Clostridium sp. FP1 TaxID=2724076 RepID=UPI0013E97DC9|nr:HNH endonuclease [Clostridium sp. FP1]MBZ9633179.1 HNH endonuclease [Clostridium sp. FP1]